ncbi:TonB-dependent receptor [Sphingomonas crocodyli]|uniref:TonB-dependent receptor n=1 Tax=Sphingomonas crocodyli TaxID=1979270 RepID=A0A437LWQ8_9SPHN|nr:TonB-dependent receptor [Sphingomonas crocodyli]RVT89767.1 TonB-dependent receptor [Sphingomonas crocodyli]
MKGKYRKAAGSSVAIAAALLAAGSAWAEQTEPQAQSEFSGVQDIVVTAQRREQRLQEVPVAITALTTANLTTNRITSVRDLDSVSPNLTVRQIVGGGQLPSYSMRGVVSIGSSIGVDRGIAVYVDGVFLGNAQGQIFELGDIQRIEVLRGPQGTLFGRNSTGGGISITSGDPKGTFGMRGTLSYGNYDQFRAVAHVDTPSFGDFSASFNYVHTQRDGDIKNLGAGTVWDFSQVGGKRYTSPKTLGGFNTDAASANLLYDGEKFRAIYKFDWSDTVLTANGQGIWFESRFAQQLRAAQPAANQAKLTPVSKTRPKAVNNAGAVPSRIKTQGHNVTLTSDLTDSISVKNIAAYRRATFAAPLSQIDGAGGLVNPGPVAFPLGAALLTPAVAASTIGQPFFIQSTSTRGIDKQWSDELQFNYESDFITATVGGLYFQQRARRGSTGSDSSPIGKARSAGFAVYPNFQVPFLGRPNTYGAIDGHVKVVSKAVYGQGEFHVMPGLDLIAGGRYTHDKKNGRDNTIVSAATPLATSSFPIQYSKGKFTYNLGYNYKPTSDILVYGKYVTGFISGGFFASVPFNPETAKSWEGGIKADWFDRRLRTNLSLFTVKYGDLQLTSTGPNVGINNTAITQVVVNAGDARAKGFEFESTISPIRQLTFNASLGYTNFKYTRIDPRLVAAVAETLVHERPKWTSSVSAQYESDPIFGDANFIARIDGNYKSKHNGISAIPLATGTNLALFGITPAEQARLKDLQLIKGYWLVNGRLALQKIDLGGTKATVALWGRNIFDAKEISYTPGFISIYSADYERARTYGVDLTVEF